MRSRLCIDEMLTQFKRLSKRRCWLHNALKNQLGLKRKPTIEELKKVEKQWEGWQAYATLYLWRSLYDETI